MTRIFRRRLNDYEKLTPAQHQKSFIKKESDFTATTAPSYLGISSLMPQWNVGPRTKKGQTGSTKTYYTSNHPSTEYFAFEVLNRIGFNTPKSRFIPWYSSIRTASKQIENYTPITTFIHDPSYPRSTTIPPELQPTADRYRLDMKKQTIIDVTTGAEYKISGNLFASNIGAVIIADSDFQPEEANVGLVKQGNRFVAYFIDKERASFTGKTYEENLLLSDSRIEKSNIFKQATREQQLFIIHTIYEAQQRGDFLRIFQNPRLLAQIPGGMQRRNEIELMQSATSFEANLHKTLASVTSHFTTEEDLASFSIRENIRATLSNSIIMELDAQYVMSAEDKQALKEIIMEDLRAPYYTHLFANVTDISAADLDNSPLIHAVIEDQKKEFDALNFSRKYQPIAHPSPFFQPPRITTIDIAEKELETALEEFTAQIPKFGTYNKKIKVAAKTLCDDLITHIKKYLELKTPTSHDFISFKNDCDNRIAKAETLLKRDISCKEAIKNFFKRIANILGRLKSPYTICEGQHTETINKLKTALQSIKEPSDEPPKPSNT